MDVINKLIDRLETLNNIYHSTNIRELIKKMKEWSRLHEEVFDHSEYKGSEQNIKKFKKLYKEVTESG